VVGSNYTAMFFLYFLADNLLFEDFSIILRIWGALLSGYFIMLMDLEFGTFLETLIRYLSSLRARSRHEYD
jgi:hypothetical protein